MGKFIEFQNSIYVQYIKYYYICFLCPFYTILYRNRLALYLLGFRFISEYANDISTNTTNVFEIHEFIQSSETINSNSKHMRMCVERITIC